MAYQIPTIFIGIGGIGTKITSEICDRISEDARKKVGFIAIDTNTTDIALRRDEGHTNMGIIQISEDREIEDILDENPEYKEWFPDEEILRKRSALYGAGQVRPISRLSFLVAAKRGRFDGIFSEIQRDRQVDGGVLSGSLVVVVVGSITGGTGAGMFIELPMFIREHLKNTGLTTLTIRGMFIGSDTTKEGQPTNFMKKAVCANAYSCIKELNAFYIHHIENEFITKEVHDNLKVSFYDGSNNSTNNVPYNYLYLFERANSLGTVGTINLGEMITYVSGIAYNLLFTAVSGNSLSIEDNFILDNIRENERNRYVGAGMCHLVFPIQEARGYVANHFINRVVSEDWLYLDSVYTERKKLANSQKLTDPDVKIPEISDVYTEVFRKETIDGGDLLLKFKEQAFDTVEKQVVSRASLYLNKIYSVIQKQISTEDITQAKNACTVNETAMETFVSARIEVGRVWDAMEEYSKYVSQLKSSIPNSLINEIFPSDKTGMAAQKKSKESLCIHTILGDKHPVVARFLIYEIINELEDNIKKLESKISRVDLNYYKNEDYYKGDKEKTTQSPHDTVEILREDYSDFWRLLGRLGINIHTEADVMKDLRKQLSAASRKFVATADTYLRDSIKYSISKFLLTRMISLAERYKDFFETIKDHSDVINKSLDEFKKVDFPFGTQGVYYTRAAFEEMANAFEDSDDFNSYQLSPKSCELVFDKIFAIYVEDYQLQNQRKLSQSAIKSINTKRKAAIENIFNEAIYKPMCLYIATHGNGTVNLTIKDALKNEGVLMGKISLYQDENSDDEERKYIGERVREILQIATPMLSTVAKDEKDNNIVFLTLSSANTVKSTAPDNANTNTKSDETSTADYYLNEAQRSFTNNGKIAINAIINDEYSDEMLTIIRISYGHVVEELNQYQPDSPNAKEYETRISDITKGIVDNELLEVTPHLNKYWHEIGFIPSLHDYQRDKDEKQIIKAFITGLSYNFLIKGAYKDFKDENGDPIKKWFYKQGTKRILIEKCGEPIGISYIDLCNALLFNLAIRKAILASVTANEDEYRDSASIEVIAAGVMNQRFILDMIQPETENDWLGSAEHNIYDIFISMFPYMKENIWEDLVTGLRNYLWQVFNKVFKENESLIDKKTKEVLEGIFNHSSLVSDKSSEESRERLFDLHESFMKEYFTKASYDKLKLDNI